MEAVRSQRDKIDEDNENDDEDEDSVECARS